MTALKVEWFKFRRRYLWSAPLCLLLAQLAWGLWSYSGNMTGKELRQGWANLLYTFPLLNAMMMPVVAAVFASRVADIEHKGRTLKQLETMQAAGTLFDAKFLCGAACLAGMHLAQTAAIVACGLYKGFGGEVPLEQLGLYLLSNLSVTLAIYLAQLILSLLLSNQMIALILGLIGSFVGLFSLFFPQTLQKLFLWAYYGVLYFTAMDWDPVTRAVDYYFVAFDWSGFALLCAIGCVLYGAGRRLFVRREV